MRFRGYSASKINTVMNSFADLALLATFLLSVPLIGYTQPAQDSQTAPLGNVKGLIVVNSGGGYPSIQEAIDSAATKGGGVVLVPSGRYVVNQIVLRDGVSLMGLGMNPPPHGEGTTLEQAAGTNSDFIVNDPKLTGGGYQHWSRISNLRIVASAGGSSRGSGIRFNARTGEGTKLEHLLIIGFPESGVSVSRGAEPFYGDDLHFFRNGSYGIDINRTGGDANQLVKLSMISGDDNGVSLIHIGPSGGLLSRNRI